MRTANGAMGLPHYPDSLSHPWRARPPVPLPPFLRNIENFKTAIYFRCGGLDLYPR